MTDLITEARELCGKATPGKEFVKKFAEIKRIINDVRTESEKLARTKQCYTCALGNQDETGTYCENAADDYDCEDEGCSNFVDGSVSYAKIAEDDLHTVLETLPELCNALEKAEEQNKRLVRELSKLACESVERDKALAKLEAEVMAIREAMASVHKSLDFADAQRQSSKNYTELAINNGLALGRIAVALKHDFKQPPPAPPEEGAEHERD